jgi:hypothetical protein
MSDSEASDWLPVDMMAIIVEEILAFDGAYPVRWSDKLAKLIQDPTVYRVVLATHAMIWGTNAEAAQHHPTAEGSGSIDLGGNCPFGEPPGPTSQQKEACQGNNPGLNPAR